MSDNATRDNLAATFEEAATVCAVTTFAEMQGGPICDVSPARTKQILRSHYLGAMLGAHDQTVRLIADTIDGLDHATSPQVIAAVIREMFTVAK